MKKIVLIIPLLLLTTITYCQLLLHAGKTSGKVSLFDSGGVALTFKEFHYDSCESTGRQIYTCEFTFKNSNPYPVILKQYRFATENVTDSSGMVGCDISRVSISKYSDTLSSNEEKIIDIRGEDKGHYRPKGTPTERGCVTRWLFSGYVPYKK